MTILPLLALFAGTCDRTPADRLLNERKFREAADAFVLVLRACPADADALTGLGRSFLGGGRAEPALQAFRKALTIKTGDRGIRLAIAEATLAAGQAPAAEDLVRQLIAEDPRNSRARHALGNLLYQGEFYQRALEAFDKSLALNARNPPARVSRAVCLIKIGDARGPAECKRLLDDPSLDPNLDLLLTYVEGQLENGQPESARQYALRAIKAFPASSLARAWHARILLEAGRSEQALAEARQGVQLNPDLPFPHSVLLQISRRAGQTAEAAREADWLRAFNTKRTNSGGR